MVWAISLALTWSALSLVLNAPSPSLGSDRKEGTMTGDMNKAHRIIRAAEMGLWTWEEAARELMKVLSGREP